MPKQHIDSSTRERLLQETAENTPYGVDAFVFVLDSFPSAIAPVRLQDHIDAAELCWLVRDRSIIKYGSEARNRLGGWSIYSCEDIGKIVYAMIDSGLMQKTDQDSQGDFNAVFDFDAAFRAGAKPRFANSRYQWSLSTMLVITTIVAIAFAGFVNLGLAGAVGTVLSSWFGFAGVVCVVLGLRDRSRGWLLSVCLGCAIFAIAITGFLAITLNNTTQ